MRRLALFALLAGIVSVPAIAQEEGKIPTPLPLVARFTDAQGRLLVGGGPEVEEIAAVLGAYVQARVVGTSGAVPLLEYDYDLDGCQSAASAVRIRCSASTSVARGHARFRRTKPFPPGPNIAPSFKATLAFCRKN